MDQESTENAAAPTPALPPEPQEPTTINASPELVQLRLSVINAILDLPAYFQSRINIHDIDLTDLPSLNIVLGSSIERQVVRVLNAQRDRWDDGTWAGYTFVRYSQTFPDVRLERTDNAGKKEVALGIELKGWYILAKEKKPNFRFQATPAACAPVDIAVVVPWHLDEVVSGTPVAMSPYIAPAAWLAEARNYWWQYVRGTQVVEEKRGVITPKDAHPYPPPKTKMNDKPHEDAGNFGRMARVSLPGQYPKGVMEEFIAKTHAEQLLGVTVADWVKFVKTQTEGTTKEAVDE